MLCLLLNTVTAFRPRTYLKRMPVNSLDIPGVHLRPRCRALPCLTSPGLQRRRLIPAPLPDNSSPGRKAGATGQWVDLPPLGGSLKDAFEIKVYEIDDVERLQRCKEGMVTEVRELDLHA